MYPAEVIRSNRGPPSDQLSCKICPKATTAAALMCRRRRPLSCAPFATTGGAGMDGRAEQNGRSVCLFLTKFLGFLEVK